MGHGDGNDCLVPKELDNFEEQVVEIACGHSHSGAITAEGNLYMWGCNPDCRLMIQDRENKLMYSLHNLYFRPTLTILSEKRFTNDKNATRYEALGLSLGVTHTAVITSTFYFVKFRKRRAVLCRVKVRWTIRSTV